jgi:hypothetical protein
VHAVPPGIDGIEEVQIDESFERYSVAASSLSSNLVIRGTDNSGPSARPSRSKVAAASRSMDSGLAISSPNDTATRPHPDQFTQGRPRWRRFLRSPLANCKRKHPKRARSIDSSATVRKRDIK